MQSKNRPEQARPAMPDYMHMQQQQAAEPGNTVEANRVIFYLTQQISQQAQTIAMLQSALEAQQNQNAKGAK